MPATFTAVLGLTKMATGEESSTWGGILNTNFDSIDTAICGYLAKSVAGSSDVTLTAAEALNAVVEFTGVLTGNISVIVPTKERISTFFNNTTGNFTLTVKTTAGTGIALSRGTKALFVCDGTNVIWGPTGQFGTLGQLTYNGGYPAITVGGSSAHKLQISAAVAALQLMTAHVASAVGPDLTMGKSRNATPGSFTIVQNGDTLGSWTIYADDGTDMATPAAQMRAVVNGTPGANDMPTKWVLAVTADGANTLTDVMTLDSSGINAVLGATTPAAATVTSMNGGQLSGFRNALLNGAMMIAQRGTSFTSATTPANSDDTNLLDRWILLSDGNDIVDVTQATEAPTGGLNSIGLDIETVNKKFGILQVIEQKNCIGLIGNTVTLSFKAKVSATTKLDNIKAAILSWDSTADAVTSDIVSAWGIEGTNPTLVSNWGYENTPANLNPTTSWATYSVSGIVDLANAKNIGVFIWSDVTDTTLGDFLYITDVQLEIGSVATPFERVDFATQLTRCKRYYEKTRVLVWNGAGTGAGLAHYLWNVEKRADPTMTITPDAGSGVGVTADGSYHWRVTTANNATDRATVTGDSEL